MISSEIGMVYVCLCELGERQNSDNLCSTWQIEKISKHTRDCTAIDPWFASYLILWYRVLAFDAAKSKDKIENNKK